MNVVTFFFCGTSLNKDALDKQELIALLHANSIKDETHLVFIFDGPGSQSTLSLAWIRGNLFGYGWENNVSQALSVLRRYDSLTQINLVGYSRGAITCHMLANAIAKDAALIKRKCDVSIFAIEPVPGPFCFQEERVKLPAIVGHYYAIFVRDDPSLVMTALVPEFDAQTEVEMMILPGNHFTVVGLMEPESYWRPFSSIQKDKRTYCVSQMARHWIETRMQNHGHQFTSTLDWDLHQALKAYQEIQQLPLSARKKWQHMIIGLPHWGQRPVSMGTSKVVGIDELAEQPPGFVNRHHQMLHTRYMASVNQYTTVSSSYERFVRLIKNKQPSTELLCRHLEKTPADLDVLFESSERFSFAELSFAIKGAKQLSLLRISHWVLAHEVSALNLLQALLHHEHRFEVQLLGDFVEADIEAVKPPSKGLSRDKINGILAKMTSLTLKFELLESLFIYILRGQDLGLYAKRRGHYPAFHAVGGQAGLSPHQLVHIQMLKHGLVALLACHEDEHFKASLSGSLLLSFETTPYSNAISSEVADQIEGDAPHGLPNPEPLSQMK